MQIEASSSEFSLPTYELRMGSYDRQLWMQVINDSFVLPCAFVPGQNRHEQKRKAT